MRALSPTRCANPGEDGAEHDLAELAAAVNNLSLRPAELGRLDEALDLMREAVSHYRRLASTDPSFLPDLAICLNNLSNRLVELGRWEQALAPIEEAVRHYRTLARASREAFLPDLSLSLGNLSGILAEVGRSQEAELVAREAAVLGLPYEWLPDASRSGATVGQP